MITGTASSDQDADQGADEGPGLDLVERVDGKVEEGRARKGTIARMPAAAAPSWLMPRRWGTRSASLPPNQ